MTGGLPIHMLVTGTSTGVGKTITTAAFASALTSAGWRVVVVKPVQAGAEHGEPSDAETIRLLTGLKEVHELASLPDPLAPDTAARLRGLPTPSVGTLAAQITRHSDSADFVLIEGAGGVLVRLDTDGGTLLDLGRALASDGGTVYAVVVTTLALGTLNHTELTVQAIRSAGLAVVGLVVGSVPSELGLAETCNESELPRVTGLPLLATLPADAGALTPEAFRSAAQSWLRRYVLDLGPPPRQR
jgi:dethiobiotin synthetase